jgi:hypothetical protein
LQRALSFLVRHRLKLTGSLAVAALAGLTVYYTIPVFSSAPEAAQVAQAPSSNRAASFGDVEVMTPRDTTERVVIDPHACQANDPNVVTTKQATTCTVAIDLKARPIVRGMAGFCKDLDMTSPENSASKLVLIFKGSNSLILALSATGSEVVPSLTDNEPPVSISGISDDYAGVDCSALPADPN